MSRIRTIKPEFWTSEQVMECSPLARLAFIGMWNFCDDNGVHPASFKTLKAEVFPGDDITATTVQNLVNELILQRLLVEFQAEGRQWWFVTGWHHQLINRPSKSRYPLPPRDAPQPKAAELDADQDQPKTLSATQYPVTLTDNSVITHGAITDDSLSTHGVLTERSLQEGKGKEGKGREEEGSIPSPPSARSTRTPKAPLPADLAITPELQTWAKQHGYHEDLDQHLEHFRDKASANGYRYADWRAALRNAIRDDWAGLRKPTMPERPAASGGGRTRPMPVASTSPEGSEFDTILRNLSRPVIEGEAIHELH